jgi:DNA-binding transcriptional LysR family regulator
MRIFCTVAELSSFSAAANKLNIAHSAVSKHVAMLERRLSTRLLNRTSRRVSLTEVGARYLEQARRILDTVEETEAAIRDVDAKPFGTLKVSIPPWLVNRDFVTLLADYRQTYPDVQLTIDIDLIERGVSLDYDDIDVALRVTNTPNDRMPATHLTTFPFRLVATPAFLDVQGRPSSPNDVNGWPLLHYSAYSFDGTITFRSGHRVRFNPALYSSSASLLYLALLEGMGPAFMPAALVERDVKEGRLEFVLPEGTASPMKLYAIYSRRLEASAKVKTFLEFLRAVYS